MKAELKSYRQSPRKVRLVADAIRGKKVEEALTILDFIPKRASLPLKKLIASAHANALRQGSGQAGKAENLVIKELKVDGGAILYRRRPRSRGMANPIRKRTSHVTVILAEKMVRQAHHK